ncbi:hypothetical protein CANARDRAFT_27596 [[Candida] arabinofermentans NRRL YB-2248]|uniref:Uncharacterized protein n=1 Tax=[Candida] arabinofermentans NRRL YB-2248 TaxID=983967 RepID=A0A1E4T3N5_9ASCO|nr:hypothetical protein CANARDRAFT_27596 [[Candida] arabinofermentans NRRL YB-2248]
MFIRGSKPSISGMITISKKGDPSKIGVTLFDVADNLRLNVCSLFTVIVVSNHAPSYNTEQHI